MSDFTDHFGAMLRAANVASEHAGRGAAHGRIALGPDDVTGPDAETRGAAIAACLDENAKAEAAIADFLRHAQAHAEQARAILQRTGTFVREQEQATAKWEATAAILLDASTPKGSA